MGILDVFRSSPPSMETISTTASAPPPPGGPALVVLICPNHGKILGFEAQVPAPETCCPTVPVVRADVRTVRMHPADGTVVGCVRL